MSDSSKVVELDRSWRRHFQRGIEALRQGRHETAVRAFERALALAPDEPEVMLALGRQRLRQGRHDEAETLLRRVITRRPDSAVATAMLARVLGLHLDRAEEAFALVQRFLQRFPETGPLQVIRGELLLEQGALLEARAAFGQVLDRDLADAAARSGLARTYNAEGIALSEKGEVDRAIFAFKRAVDLDAQWSAPCVNLGVALGRLGRLSQALAAYRAALDREPDNPVAYFNIGVAYHEQGDHRSAAGALEQLLELCPDYPQVRLTLAAALFELGEFGRCIALLLEELEIDELSVPAWTSLGLAYVCSGNPDRGEQCLQRALALDPRCRSACHNLAMLYLTQERDEEAEALLLRVEAMEAGLATGRIGDTPAPRPAAAVERPDLES